MGSLAQVLLVLGFALGAVVYAGIAYWLVRGVRTLWQLGLRVAWDGRTRAELNAERRRFAQMHRVGETERELRRAA